MLLMLLQLLDFLNRIHEAGQKGRVLVDGGMQGRGGRNGSGLISDMIEKEVALFISRCGTEM